MTEIVNPNDFVKGATYRLDGPRDLIDTRKKSIFSWRKDESPVTGVLINIDKNNSFNNDYWGELIFNVIGSEVRLCSRYEDSKVNCNEVHIHVIKDGTDGKFYVKEFNVHADEWHQRVTDMRTMDEQNRVHIYNHAAPGGLNGGTRHKRHTKRKSQKRRKRRTHRRR